MSKKNPEKKGLIKEFKEFISRGSVLDLAVGMIIGAAFTAIITAVVNYVLKPLISLIPLGESGTFKTVLKPAVAEVSDAVTGEVIVAAQEEVAILWSEVISAIITFLATALVLFIIVKAINTAKAKAEKAKAELEAKKQAEEEKVEEPAPAPAEPVIPEDIKLLSEIRDLLKAKE